jgi:hypothetical protein
VRARITPMNEQRVCSINQETGLPNDQFDRDPRNAGAILATECGKQAHFKVSIVRTDHVIAYACYEHIKKLHETEFRVTEIES